MSSSERDLSKVLPDFFPATVPSCQEASHKFFDCFSRNSSDGYKSSGSKDSGDIALSECLELKKKYEECFTKEAITNKNVKTRRYRVCLIYFNLRYVAY